MYQQPVGARASLRRPQQHQPGMQVFSWGESTAHKEMQRACFDYLALGGWYSEGPVSLLSGLNPRPAVLVMHFFAVAVYGFGRLQLPRPTFKYALTIVCVSQACPCVRA